MRFGFSSSWCPAYLPDSALSRFRIETEALHFEGLDNLRSYSGTEVHLFELDGMMLMLAGGPELSEDIVLEALRLRAESAQVERLHNIGQVLLAEAASREGYSVWVPRADYPHVASLLSVHRSAVALLDELPPLTTNPGANRVCELIDLVCVPTEPFKPPLLYEIETSTSIQSGLIRMLEVYSYRMDVRGFIVAQGWRRPKFDKEIHKVAFLPIRSIVKFLSIESVQSS